MPRRARETTDDPLWIVSHDGTVLMANDAAERMLRGVGGSHVGRDFLELVPSAVRPALRSALARRDHSREAYGIDFGPGAPGLQLWLQPLSAADDTAFAITLPDRSAKARVEAALRDSDDRLRRCLAAASAGIWEWDLRTDGNVWSPELWSLYGLDPHQYPATFESWSSSVHQEDRARAAQQVRDAAQQGTRLAAEWRVAGQHPPRWLYSRGQPELDAQGKVVRYLGVVMDVTERKLQQQALAASRARLEAALASMADAVLVYDAQGRVVEHNDAFARLFGLASKADCPQDVTQLFQGIELLHEDGGVVPSELRPAQRALRGELLASAEYVARRVATGERLNISTSCAPIRDEAGDVIGCVVTLRDVTELKRSAAETAGLEARLQQALRLESIGRLAGGVAHDFNNMLTVIAGNAELALALAGEDGPTAAQLHEIVGACRRSSELVRQLLSFARKQSIVPKLVDLNTLIPPMLNMLRRLIGDHIELEWRAGPSLWSVRVDTSQLDQIVMNLCVNARDALDGRPGKISLETSNVEITAAELAALPELAPGAYVRLSVTDTGCGMDAVTLASAFEPFFTTKPTGQGTGLGLSTVYGAVKQNGGTLAVHSAVGEGSCFSVYLPRFSEPALRASRARAPAAAVSGRESILLVQDSVEVLRMTERMLGKRGYRVVVASTPGEAIELVRARGRELAGLVTNLLLPQMSGLSLVRELRRLAPQLKCLFISGYGDELVQREARLQGVQILQKPFSAEALAAALRVTLDA